MKIEIDINSCRECPFKKTEQLFTCDGRPEGFQWICSKGCWKSNIPEGIHANCIFRK